MVVGVHAWAQNTVPTLRSVLKSDVRVYAAPSDLPINKLIFE